MEISPKPKKMSQEQLDQLDRITLMLDTYHKGEWNNHNGTYETLVFKDGYTKPALEEFNSKVSSIESQFQTEKVRKQRQEQYPFWPEQLDKIWHAIDNDADLKTKFADFYNSIKTVKDNNPKP